MRAMLMNKKIAVGLFSGGLDSWLSAILIHRQGFDVHLLHFVSPYFGYSGEKLEEARKRVEEKGMRLIVHEFGEDYIQNVVKKPKHGVGSSMNPCIDCHRYMLSMANKKREELNAEFVFSGEVLEQRPMSQNKRALHLIEKESGLSGFLVRPLSAKLLDPSIPEQRGILDREKLLNISGRGRSHQVALAKELGLDKYPQPAGGCKFTDPNLKKRFLTLRKINKDITWNDLKLLISARHFLLDDDALFTVARDEKECSTLFKDFPKDILIEASDMVPSAVGLLIKYSKGVKVEVDLNSDYAKMAGRIIARYSKAHQQGKDKINVSYFKDGGEVLKKELTPFTDAELLKYRL